jgi:TolB-like protein
MIHKFADFELDTAKFELRSRGQSVAIEPQVFRLILLLLDNADRLVTRDEIIDQIWNGRIVSEAALSSRIKSARQALGDSGASQHMIRTIHGRGFRFVCPLVGAVFSTQSATAGQPPEGPANRQLEQERPSIAVLPFALVNQAGEYAGWAQALPHDLIAELSRLHWLFVIARGSSFRFSSATADVSEVGRALGVRYCLTGTIEHIAGKTAVVLELANTLDSGVVWSERYEVGAAQVHEVRTRIVADVLSALEVRIPAHEATKSRLQDPNDLTAWAAYHLGLQHLFRFTRDDNLRALDLLERAARIDPNFARAHAGMSFGHFQNAFLQYGAERAEEVASAIRYAEQALQLDPLDPFANLTMGRAHWLTGEIDASLGWLERSIELNPNYAQGLYSRAWTEMILGQNEQSQVDVDGAISRSPLDPMRYAMLATRALAHLQRDEFALAAAWAENAARAPGAHHLIGLIAVACHQLNGDQLAAARWADHTRRRAQAVSSESFFRSFPFADRATQVQIATALRAHGF